jgi:hypothetical protein
MASDSVVYTFFGKVLPERVNVTIPQLVFHLIQYYAGIDGELSVSIDGETKYISGSEKCKLFTVAWDIVGKYIEYACNGYEVKNI